MAKEKPVGRVVLKDVRGSFLHLFVPQAFNGDDADSDKRSFGANFLIDPTSVSGKANLAKMKKAKEAVMEKKWGNNQPKLKADKICTRDGNDEARDEYQGMYFVSCSRPEFDKNGAFDPPTVIDNRKDSDDKWIRLEARDGRPYSGCFVNAIVTLWAQDNKYGKRVNATLESVQYLRKGEAFSQATPVDVDEEFSDDDVENADVDEIEDPDADGEDNSSSTDDGDDDLV